MRDTIAPATAREAGHMTLVNTASALVLAIILCVGAPARSAEVVEDTVYPAFIGGFDLPKPTASCLSSTEPSAVS